MNEPFLTRQPFIPLRLRKKIGKLRPVKPGMPFRCQIFGQHYEGTTGIHMDDKIWQYGLHEASTVNLIRDILTRQRASGILPVYMDVGTNAGMHLIAAAPLTAKAFGFEPWKNVRDKALHNISINALDNVILFDFGLSNENADLPFRPPAQNNLGVGMFVGSAGADTIILKVRRGDDVVREHGITPTLIKLDIEGHEKHALLGLRDTIVTARPDIIFEYSAASRSDLGEEAARHALFGADYNFYGIKRSREKPSLATFNPSKKYENVLATVRII